MTPEQVADWASHNGFGFLDRVTWGKYFSIAATAMGDEERIEAMAPGKHYSLKCLLVLTNRRLIITQFNLSKEPTFSSKHLRFQDVAPVVTPDGRLEFENGLLPSQLRVQINWFDHFSPMLQRVYAAIREDRLSTEAEIVGQIRTRIAGHLDALRTKRRQLVRRNAYGIRHDEKWQEEKNYFISRVLLADDFSYADLREETREAIPSWIDEALDVFEEKGAGAAALRLADEPSRFSGPEYETLCAEALERDGWQVRLTRATGDQGVDIIARRGPVKLILQCKYYGQPVGNKAVQEVIAAKEFEDGTHAGVVSNSTYTPAAQQLAEKAGVLLLHHADLPSLTKRLGLT